MLDFLKPLKQTKHDCLIFISGEKEDSIHIEGSDYRNPGVKIGGNDLGDAYHVLLYKHDSETDEIIDVDRFDCILADPLEYMSGLIPSGFYGILAKKTTTSSKIVNKLLDFARKKMYN